MGNRKDIGKLFNERFKGFEQAPGADLWDSIASELDQKNDRKIAPLWLYFGGFLIVGLLTGLLYWHPWDISDTINTKEQTLVLNQDTINKEKTNSASHNQNDTTTDVKKYDITNTKPSDTNTITDSEITPSNKAAITNNTSAPIKKDTSTSSKNLTTGKSQLVATNKNANYNSLEENNAINAASSNSDKKATSIAAVLNTLENTLQKLKNQKELEAKIAYQAKVKEELADAITVQKEENKIVLQKWLDSIESISASKKAELAISYEEGKKSTIEEKAPKLPKTEEERENDRKESVNYKFAISPYTSLLNYGSLTKGSSIDNRLVDNPRDAIRTVGYGVRADYKFSEKSSIRFGIGVTPLQYRTDDFQILVTNNNNVNIFQLSGIDPQNLNQSNGGIETSPEVLAFFNSNDVVNIEQNISYAEVPLDYQYNFLNKRVSMSFNGGISLFVLTNNKVYATARSGEKIFIGRETSLNDLSLALNFGLGTYYNFSKNWRFDVEPAFKYQLNPYTDNIGNFRPYYFGLQFGMSYKF